MMYPSDDKLNLNFVTAPTNLSLGLVGARVINKQAETQNHDISVKFLFKLMR